MTCCFPSGGGEQSRIAAVLDQQIRAERRKAFDEVKVLLLGAGESGKSTFAKQMKIMHMNGFTSEERVSFRYPIRKNILDSITTLLKACKHLGIEINPEHEEAANNLLRAADDFFSEAFARDIKRLWSDPGVQEAVRRASEFQYFYSTPYYIRELDRIAQENFTPTDQDILYSRFPTTGIVETVFTVQKVTIRMCDVGGQRSERRKWIHCFTDVKAVLMIVGISEYDQVLRENNEVNRMHDALKLFADICNSKWFERTTIIVFLNKIDLFTEKIERVPLSTCFPEYDGPNTFEATTSFIMNQFRKANKSMNKLLSFHYSCATDTSQIMKIFGDVKNTILRDSLSDF